MASRRAPRRPPPRSAFTRGERALLDRLATPDLVQAHLAALPYNPADTVRSFRGVFRARRAHCLEGALFAATVLEQHGHPPRLLDLESRDGLDHVVCLVRENGRYGAVGASQFPGLHGRKPVYPTIRQLALSYYEPYVDETGRVKAYGVLDLREGPDVDWRFSGDDLWDLHDHLLEMPHRPLPTSDARYRALRERYRRFKAANPHEEPIYYRTVPNWLPEVGGTEA